MLLTLCLWMGFPCLAKENKLIILSAHRKSIQLEFSRKFEEYSLKNYGETIEIEWIGQGGASDDHRYLLSKFKKNPQTAGIDIFWGGGEYPHLDLTSKKLLEPHYLSPELRKNIPQQYKGITFYNAAETWHAASLSSFGIFYNKKLIKLLKIEEPRSWEDLAGNQFYDLISITDPRRSSSFLTMAFVVLQAYGSWDKGWEVLSKIAANAKSFNHSSSAPIKSVISGETLVGLSVAYFAIGKIGDLGTNNLGFQLPPGKTILNTDPISIIKGAPNLKAARRFVDFTLGKEGQKLLILPKGVEGGPQYSSLGLMAINRLAYQETQGKRIQFLTNPFNSLDTFFTLNLQQSIYTQFVIADLIGAVHVDTHKELKRAKLAMSQKKLSEKELKYFFRPFVTQKETLEYSRNWHDQVFRNRKINQWIEEARKRYKQFH